MKGIIELIKTGEYELVDSGIFHILEKETTSLSFGLLSLIFSFEKSDTAEPSIRVETPDEKKIKFILTNINLPSYGTTEFVKFGKDGEGKDIYISFRVHTLNDKSVRSLEYSIYKK